MTNQIHFIYLLNESKQKQKISGQIRFHQLPESDIPFFISGILSKDLFIYILILFYDHFNFLLSHINICLHTNTPFMRNRKLFMEALYFF